MLYLLCGCQELHPNFPRYCINQRSHGPAASVAFDKVDPSVVFSEIICQVDFTAQGQLFGATCVAIAYVHLSRK